MQFTGHNVIVSFHCKVEINLGILDHLQLIQALSWVGRGAVVRCQLPSGWDCSVNMYMSSSITGSSITSVTGSLSDSTRSYIVDLHSYTMETWSESLILAPLWLIVEHLAYHPNHKNTGAERVGAHYYCYVANCPETWVQRAI